MRQMQKIATNGCGSNLYEAGGKGIRVGVKDIQWRYDRRAWLQVEKGGQICLQ